MAKARAIIQVAGGWRWGLSSGSLISRPIRMRITRPKKQLGVYCRRTAGTLAALILRLAGFDLSTSGYRALNHRDPWAGWAMARRSAQRRPVAGRRRRHRRDTIAQQNGRWPG